MNLDERVQAFELFFDALQSTNSRLEKEQEVKVFINAFPELQEDWTYILETLDGKHPIGWTFRPRFEPGMTSCPEQTNLHTIKDFIRLCELTPDKSFAATSRAELIIGPYGDFLAPIVNRTLRLGIGKSLLAKSDVTPMLAKKYEGGFLTGDFAVTEKLDGNRCVAAYNRELGKWEFFSRSGKPMKVNFDMSGFDTELIYDGEVMSTEQTNLSVQRYKAICDDVYWMHDTRDAQLMFNHTSGLINQHGTNKKGLVYNVFDIIDGAPYYARRDVLERFHDGSDDVRILPTLYVGGDSVKMRELLGRITQMGGEGIMLNRIGRGYEQKRSDALLKYKEVKFLDMKVTGGYGGNGKYAGLVGGLYCELKTDDGKIIRCEVGSGLSDQQRIYWAENAFNIIGKIVQVGYHELTQSEENIGTNEYSLRFPRLIKIRYDKGETSEY